MGEVTFVSAQWLDAHPELTTASGLGEAAQDSGVDSSSPAELAAAPGSARLGGAAAVPDMGAGIGPVSSTDAALGPTAGLDAPSAAPANARSAAPSEGPAGAPSDAASDAVSAIATAAAAVVSSSGVDAVPTRSGQAPSAADHAAAASPEHAPAVSDSITGLAPAPAPALAPALPGAPAATAAGSNNPEARALLESDTGSWGDLDFTQAKARAAGKGTPGRSRNFAWFAAVREAVWVRPTAALAKWTWGDQHSTGVSPGDEAPSGNAALDAAAAAAARGGDNPDIGSEGLGVATGSAHGDKGAWAGGPRRSLPSPPPPPATPDAGWLHTQWDGTTRTEPRPSSHSVGTDDQATGHTASHTAGQTASSPVQPAITDVARDFAEASRARFMAVMHPTHPPPPPLPSPRQKALVLPAVPLPYLVRPELRD